MDRLGRWSAMFKGHQGHHMALCDVTSALVGKPMNSLFHLHRSSISVFFSDAVIKTRKKIDGFASQSWRVCLRDGP